MFPANIEKQNFPYVFMGQKNHYAKIGKGEYKTAFLVSITFNHTS